MAVLITAVLPARAGVLAPGFRTPMVAFEFARTHAEVEALLGTERVTAAIAILVAVLGIAAFLDRRDFTEAFAFSLSVAFTAFFVVTIQRVRAG